jgi:putative redox protein
VAGAEYRAQVKWIEGLQFVARGLGSETAIVLDGAVENGGLGQGLRPFEALLSAMAGCSAMDVVLILQKMRQEVTGLTVNVVGERGEEHPRPLVRATIEYVVRGQGLSPQAVERAVRLSQTKYCGVIASLKTEVQATYRVEEG